MHIRTVNSEDSEKIKILYSEVARLEGGIARLEHEITDDYVDNFIKKSLSTGLILAAENPEVPEQFIAEIHACKPGIKIFDHILNDLTLVIHPAFQGKKLGRTIFTIFLEEVARNRPDVGRVELVVRESNRKAIELFQSLGFRVEGRFEMRIKTSHGTYEADIPMGWQNPSYEF